MKNKFLSLLFKPTNLIVIPIGCISALGINRKNVFADGESQSFPNRIKKFETFPNRIKKESINNLSVIMIFSTIFSTCSLITIMSQLWLAEDTNLFGLLKNKSGFLYKNSRFILPTIYTGFFATTIYGTRWAYKKIDLELEEMCD